MFVLKVKKSKAVNEAMDATMGVSNMVQGNGYGYVYRILPFNKNLEQKVNQVTDDYYIYPGCMVTGKGYFDESKKYTGLVMSVRKNANGEVQVVYVKTTRTNRMVALSPDGLELIMYNKPTEKCLDMNLRNPSKLFTPSYNVSIG